MDFGGPYFKHSHVIQKTFFSYFSQWNMYAVKQPFARDEPRRSNMTCSFFPAQVQLPNPKNPKHLETLKTRNIPKSWKHKHKITAYSHCFRLLSGDRWYNLTIFNIVLVYFLHFRTSPLTRTSNFEPSQMITPNLDDLGTENDTPFCLSISAGFSWIFQI